jgi:hypothetical protein
MDIFCFERAMMINIKTNAASRIVIGPPTAEKDSTGGYDVGVGKSQIATLSGTFLTDSF